MIVDLLYLTKNRKEFTAASLDSVTANTNWDLVRKLWLCDDGSVDGTEELLISCVERMKGKADLLLGGEFGAPAAVMNAFVNLPNKPDYFAKLDNDVIVPPGWLDACVRTVEAFPALDLLGIEPPLSRVPHYAWSDPSRMPELSGHVLSLAAGTGVAPCESIGGLGLMKTAAFLSRPPLQPHSVYGGFTEWQINDPTLSKCWIVPPLNVFLLDRIPFEPWVSLSKLYEQRGWQRGWQDYPAQSSELWKWWLEANACPA